MNGKKFEDFSKYKAVIVGTGPSLDLEQLAYIVKRRDEDKCRIFCGNNAYQVIPPDVIFSNNPEWWDYYWERSERLRDLECPKWTWDQVTAEKYNINHVPGVWAKSLSTDPMCIHYGSSTGYEILGIAYHYKVKEMILVGYDMKYPKGYNGPQQISGGKRHYFGEYPKELQHWPRSPKSVDSNGNIIGLIRKFETIDCKELGIRIINSTPGSSLTCFPMVPLEEALC